MLITINPRSGVPIYRQIVEQVRRLILTRQVVPGTQIPSVRDLAAEIRVNPMTVSKAYSLLEQEGLLERRRGVGLFARELSEDKLRQDGAEILGDLLKNAAISAIQMNISIDDAVELLRKHYNQHIQQKGNEE